MLVDARSTLLDELKALSLASDDATLEGATSDADQPRGPHPQANALNDVPDQRRRRSQLDPTPWSDPWGRRRKRVSCHQLRRSPNRQVQ